MLSVQKDILYKSGDLTTSYEDERCRLDLYCPTDAPKAWLVWFHGGGLVGGDKGGDGHIATWLAERGVGVALCNYRLSPTANYPAYVHDALAAFEWLHRHLNEKGMDNGNMFVGGHSAGAYLAALIALKPSPLAQRMRGSIPMSGQMVTHFTVRAERGLSEYPVVVDDAAPIFHVRADAPPLCLLISNNDLPGRLEENAYLAAMMKVAGHTQTEFHCFDDRNHGSIGELFATEGDPVCEVVLDFIERWGQ